MRTGGRKTTFRTKYRRYQPLINFYQYDEGKAYYFIDDFHE